MRILLLGGNGLVMLGEQSVPSGLTAVLLAATDGGHARFSGRFRSAGG